MSEELEKIKEVMFTKINLEPGDVLFVTLKSDSINSGDLHNLGESFRAIFPNNKVALVNLSTNDEITLTALKDESSIEKECCGGNCHSEGEDNVPG